jgi:hypothetical protein
MGVITFLAFSEQNDRQTQTIRHTMDFTACMLHFAVGSRRVCKRVTHKALSPLTPNHTRSTKPQAALADGGVVRTQVAESLATKLTD